jgi:hypothetical protein
VIIIWVKFFENVTGEQGPVELVVGHKISFDKNFLDHKSQLVIIRLLLKGQLIGVLEKRVQKVGLFTAEVSRLGLNLKFCNIVKLLNYWSLVVDPDLFGIYTDYQEVDQRYDIIPST